MWACRLHVCVVEDSCITHFSWVSDNEPNPLTGSWRMRLSVVFISQREAGEGGLVLSSQLTDHLTGRQVF